MGKRKRIPTDTETRVLVRSKRRCCICFHLDECLAEKKGQIVHLDHDRSNCAEENLAFLCIPHHDEYDSSTSQSKGLKPKEAKYARQRLYRYYEDKPQVWVKVKIDRDFTSYTDGERDRLLGRIREAIAVGDNIEVRRNKGCVELSLKLTPEQAKQLYAVFEGKRLAPFGVTDVWLESSDLEPKWKDVLVAAGLTPLLSRGPRRIDSSRSETKVVLLAQACRAFDSVLRQDPGLSIAIWQMLLHFQRGESEPPPPPGKKCVVQITLPDGSRRAKVDVSRPDKDTLIVECIHIG